jgi:hypothetical protein
MNDQHNNEQTDKEMLTRSSLTDPHRTGWVRPNTRERRPASDLLDWIDGLNDWAVSEVLHWLATSRPTVLREARRALIGPAPSRLDSPERIQAISEARNGCALTARFPHHKPGVLVGCTCDVKGIFRDGPTMDEAQARLDNAQIRQSMAELSEAQEPRMADLPEPCPVCHKVHGPPKVVGPTGVIFWPGHEYIIRTRYSNQKYPREWRMGYLGFSNGMEFSARGPGRTHGSQYGGTQNIGLESIIYAKEVEHDDAKRHVGRIVR